MKASTYAKKIICFILAGVLAIAFASCKDETGNENVTGENMTEAEEIPDGSISVPYTSLDSLNPFYTKSVLNSIISSLVYRSLYRLDSSFSSERDLALSESINGLTLKVYLVPELVFSDLAPMTPEDVVYSFDLAKKSPLYGAGLSGISECTAGDDNSVVFTLTENNRHILGALTFPIVKSGTAAGEDFLPVGNGFYQFHQDGIRLTLKANLKFAGTLPNVGTVRLTDVKGNADPENLVSTGEIDFYYSDLADADISGVNSAVTSVYLNNLVYIGVNHQNVNLVLSSFRRAVSYAIDRQTITENAYRGFARGTGVPFNISWKEYSSSASASSLSVYDPLKTAELLGERGFGEGGNPLNLTLLCNEGNSFLRNTASLIASSLAPYNINITIQLMNSEGIEKAVKAGNYDLYLGEIKLPSTMDLSQFFTVGGNAAYGIDFQYITSDEEYVKYKNGEISIDSFIETFCNDMPFIPLLYRNGRLCYTRSITSELSVTEGDMFGDIYKWTFS